MGHRTTESDCMIIGIAGPESPFSEGRQGWPSDISQVRGLRMRYRYWRVRYNLYNLFCRLLYAQCSIMLWSLSLHCIYLLYSCALCSQEKPRVNDQLVGLSEDWFFIYTRKSIVIYQQPTLGKPVIRLWWCYLVSVTTLESWGESLLRPLKRPPPPWILHWI